MNLFVDKTDGLYYNNEVVSERRSSVADLTEVYRVKLSVKEVLADSVRLYLQHFRHECEKDGCPDTGPPAGTRAGQ